MNFQLLKKRNFNTIFSDTFSFFKAYGKPYFKGFFLINGGVILLLLVTMYFFSKNILDSMVTSLNTNYSGFKTYEPDFFGEPSSVVLTILITLLAIVLSMVMYLYPIGFLSKIAANEAVTTESLFGFIKKRMMKAILFFFASLVTFVPIILLVSLVIGVLTLFLIGIPLMIIVYPAILIWIVLAFYDNMSTSNSFFTSLGVGFNFLFTKFWTNWGSAIIISMIINIVGSIIFFVPYLINMISFFTSMKSVNIEDASFNDASTNFFIVTLIISVISMLVSFVLQNLLLINLGVIYYSNVEERDNLQLNTEIDDIGNN